MSRPSSGFCRKRTWNSPAVSHRGGLEWAPGTLSSPRTGEGVPVSGRENRCSVSLCFSSECCYYLSVSLLVWFWGGSYLVPCSVLSSQKDVYIPWEKRNVKCCTYGSSRRAVRLPGLCPGEAVPPHGGETLFFYCSTVQGRALPEPVQSCYPDPIFFMTKSVAWHIYWLKWMS